MFISLASEKTACAISRSAVPIREQVEDRLRQAILCGTCSACLRWSRLGDTSSKKCSLLSPTQRRTAKKEASPQERKPMMMAERRIAGAESATVLLQQIEGEDEATESGISRLAKDAARHAWITASGSTTGSHQKHHICHLAADRRSPATKNSQANDQKRKAQQAMDKEAQISQLTELPLFPASHPKATAALISGTVMLQGTMPSLALKGQVIHQGQGDILAVRILGSWIPGEARQDPTGWYLQTAARVGIRLSAGLTARWETQERRA